MTLALLALLAATYDPLAVTTPEVTPVELVVSDARRSREVPLRVYLPAAPAPAPVLLFSHGLGGSREGNAFLGQHWARRGYVAVFLQHPGSDTAVWKGVEQPERLAAMKSAASVENFLLRTGDVHVVLDQLTAWNATAGHPLVGRLDLARVGMSGHSFGAVTTQAVSGQKLPFGADERDGRIKAAMALSPNTPRRPDAATAFGSVSIPWLLLTGTHDVALIGQATVASRLSVFPALPAGRKYELVLDGAEHSAFTDRALPGDRQPRNPNHHRALLAVSTAFFDSVLKADAGARAWLEGSGVKSVLEPADRWQWK